MHIQMSQSEQLLLLVLIQLVVILACARLFSEVFCRLGQPQVCGEIAAGLVLGPSLLGHWFPRLFHAVFDPRVSPIFTMLSQIGLILLMFLIGLEFNFDHLSNNRKKVFSISIVGIAFPFVLGLAISKVLYAYAGAGIDARGFALFIATALSITALPILGRILIELNLNQSQLGVVTISAAAIDDIIGWVLLATVGAIVKSGFDWTHTSIMMLEVAAFALVMAIAVRPLLKKWIARYFDASSDVSSVSLAFILILVLLAAITTNLIGIFSIFGGFFMGAILYDERAFADAILRRMKTFVTVLFLPIFFTYTGLKTDISSMHGFRMWSLAGLVVAVATMGKFGGCSISAGLSGFKWREACMIGILMNTRALMELVVVNVGVDLGVIPPNVFFMLVTMAVFTTYLTTPIIQRLIHKSSLELQYRASELATRVTQPRRRGNILPDAE